MRVYEYDIKPDVHIICKPTAELLLYMAELQDGILVMGDKIFEGYVNN